MAQIMPNSNLDFSVHRMPEAESPGYPSLFRISFDGHVMAERVTKTGLAAMKREINRILKGESE